MASSADFRLTVLVNGEEVGKVKPNTFFYVDRLAGEHKISISKKAERSLSLKLEEGQVEYVRLDVRMGLFAGDVDLVSVDNAVGQRELNSMTYFGELAIVAR